MTRSGRPNVLRKYEATLASGSCRARQLGRVVGELRRRAGHLRDGVEQHLGHQPPRDSSGSRTARPPAFSGSGWLDR